MEIGAAVNTQPEPPDEKSNPWLPPRDVHDWHRYWQHRRGNRFDQDYGPVPDGGICLGDSRLIQCLIKRGAKTVLCAGNGISQEPRALAAAGFEVTAMDLSPLAVHLAETWQFSSRELNCFCTKEWRTPDRTVRFVIGDLLDRSVCPGPFDAIIERRMLQLFPEQEQGVALDALASRLKADGLLLSHCHNWMWPSNFFRDRGWSVSLEEVPDHDGRVVWLIISSG
jgi:SAM-dependent methyltransferase